MKDETKRKLLTGMSVFALAVVVIAPAAASWHGLVSTGRDLLKLTDGWEYLVPLTLDGAALYAGALAIRAILAGDSAFGARFLTALYAMVAAGFNAFHAYTTQQGSVAAALYFAIASLSAVVLWDVTLRALRRDQLRDLGAIEAPLPKFRLLRWLVDLPMTARAWRVAVIEQITDPNEALQRARELRGLPTIPVRTAVAERLTTTDLRELDAALEHNGEENADEQGIDGSGEVGRRTERPGEGSGDVGDSDRAGDAVPGRPDGSGARGEDRVELADEHDRRGEGVLPDGLRVADDFRLNGAALNKKEAVQAAFDHLGERNIPAALELLAHQGVTVDRSYAYTVKWSPKAAELRAIAGGAR